MPISTTAQDTTNESAAIRLLAAEQVMRRAGLALPNDELAALKPQFGSGENRRLNRQVQDVARSSGSGIMGYTAGTALMIRGWYVPAAIVMTVSSGYTGIKIAGRQRNAINSVVDQANDVATEWLVKNEFPRLSRLVKAIDSGSLDAGQMADLKEASTFWRLDAHRQLCDDAGGDLSPDTAREFAWTQAISADRPPIKLPFLGG